MINGDTLFFFDGKPHALELYTALAERICAEMPDTGIKVQKSMITFANKHGFVPSEAESGGVRQGLSDCLLWPGPQSGVAPADCVL